MYEISKAPMYFWMLLRVQFAGPRSLLSKLLRIFLRIIPAIAVALPVIVVGVKIKVMRQHDCSLQLGCSKWHQLLNCNLCVNKSDLEQLV
jgi:hypothetical protein